MSKSERASSRSVLVLRLRSCILEDRRKIALALVTRKIKVKKRIMVILLFVCLWTVAVVRVLAGLRFRVFRFLVFFPLSREQWLDCTIYCYLRRSFFLFRCEDPCCNRQVSVDNENERESLLVSCPNRSCGTSKKVSNIPALLSFCKIHN
jgi:hypothetical protein